jgi:hypothetical protein
MSVTVSTKEVRIENFVITDVAVVAAFTAAQESGKDPETFLTALLEIGAQVASLGSNSAGAEKIEASIAQAKTTIQHLAEQVQKTVKEQIASVTAEDGDLAKNIDGSLETLRSELETLVAGEDAPVRVAIMKSLEESQGKIRADITTQNKVQRDQIAQLLDPADPTSPLRDLVARIDGVAKAVADMHDEQKAIAIREDALEGGVFGGLSYEAVVVQAVQRIAALAGDDCEPTGHLTGRVPRSKKGDGIVDLKKGAAVFARMVLEAKNQALTKADWEAEAKGSCENRAATGFIGLCKHLTDMPNGNRLLFLAPNSVVLAFDPEVDSVDMLVMVYQLVKMVSMSHTGQLDEISIADVNAGVDEALKGLDKFDSLTRNANAIKNSADKILSEANGIRAVVHEQLSRIQAAIAKGSEPEALEAATSLELDAAQPVDLGE